jgi:hypothetical protein
LFLAFEYLSDHDDVFFAHECAHATVARLTLALSAARTTREPR